LQPKLVFVDDDLAVLSAYQRMLRPSGYHCEFLSEPATLLQTADLTDVRLLLVDQRMPKLSGTQLLTALHGRFPLMKRVLISGDIVGAKAELAEAVTLHAVLAKPCSKVALLQCIDRLLAEQ
jgi:DNA-binding NtrC family response regulator